MNFDEKNYLDNNQRYYPNDYSNKCTEDNKNDNIMCCHKTIEKAFCCCPINWEHGYNDNKKACSCWNKKHCENNKQDNCEEKKNECTCQCRCDNREDKIEKEDNCCCRHWEEKKDDNCYDKHDRCDNHKSECYDNKENNLTCNRSSNRCCNRCFFRGFRF